MSIKDFHAKFTSESETSELFAALRRLSRSSDIGAVKSREWIIWGD